MKALRFLLAAGFLLALALAFSCSNNEKDEEPGSGNSSSIENGDSDSSSSAVRPSSSSLEVEGGKIEGEPLEYQEQTYKTVVIGEQIWMAENLNYNASGSRCYDGSADNCAKYGRLYNWTAANTVCPPDWHLPTNEEWDELYLFVDQYYEPSGKKSYTAGEILKAADGWNDGGNGVDYYGFAALPGGNSDDQGRNSDNIGKESYWWSATEYSISNYAYYHFLSNRNNQAIWRENYKAHLNSVRCLMD